jgi:hypothetical protein
MTGTLYSHGRPALSRRLLAQDHVVAKRERGDQTQLKLQKAKELSFSPGKNFMMTAFMLVRR